MKLTVLLHLQGHADGTEQGIQLHMRVLYKQMQEGSACSTCRLEGLVGILYEIQEVW